MLSIHFRRLLKMCLLVGVLTAVFALTLTGRPQAQENHPPRTELESLPRYPLAESPEVQFALEAVTVVPGSKVAFQSYRNENWDIFIGNDDGTGQTAVTNHEMREMHPHLNRGNSAIVYASGVDEHDYEIYRMNADGNGKVALTNNEADDGNPQWSADGTRIAFESYRDGQAEIYVMNADGSDQTRLTNSGDFDGMPTWSPDGSKIAFSSRRTGAYRIWVMNADGSNPVQLSTQPYSLRPQWSPDGSKIAYDADEDNNGWQELWLMNTDGSDQQEETYLSAHNTSYWVSSWSPDGRYLAFTSIHFVYYQGNWYWDYAYQDARDISLHYPDPTTFRLSQNNLDWYPRWQTNDAQPPASQMQALPTVSPGTFTVNWSGSDTGDSGGIHHYDVQVKTGSNDNWANWQMGTTATSAQYSGTGGITYYFRVRATDRHYTTESWPGSHDTMTTIEALLPQSHVNPLSPFSRHDDNVVVTWGGHDPGGSGIANYDVQYRVNNGSWVNWQTGITETTAALPGGNRGETYSFRIRATDNAHNVANWPAGNGDTNTTFYAWGIGGVAYDNSHTPVSGITVNADAPLIGQLPPDVEGIYGIYTEDENSSYSVSWEKPGYGSLPETVYPAGPDAQVDVILPPSDNVVANWGFEAGFSNWNIGGSNSPVITDSNKHSGSQAAFLGQSNPGFTPSYKFSNGEAIHFSMVTDSRGNIHVLWTAASTQYGNAHVYYAWRSISGVWSTTESMSDEYSLGAPQLVIDDNETLHATWDDGGLAYYARKLQNGNWSIPENITVPGSQAPSTDARIAIDDEGVVHAFIPSDNSAGYYWDYFYRQRLPGGSWTNPQSVAHTYGGGTNLKLLFDHHGTLYAVWEDSTSSGYTDIFYIQRTSTGIWSSPEILSNTLEGEHSISPDFVIDSQSTVHLIWVQFAQNIIYYRQKTTNGNWSSQELLFQNAFAYGPKLAFAEDDQVHMVWPTDNYQIRYARRSVHGNWSESQLISQGIENVGQPQILTDDLSLAHVIWGSIETNSTAQDAYYTRQLSDDNWTTPLNLSNNSSTTKTPMFIMDAGGYVHAIWKDAGEAYSDFYYAGPQNINVSGESSISQVFTIPMTTTTPTLSFLYRAGGIYSAEGSHLSVMVDDGTVTGLPIIATGQGGWTHYSANLSDWTGEMVTLTLELEQEASAPAAWAVIDEVTVGSTSDNWVSIDNGNAAPGQGVVQTLTYGNQGGAAADGVTLTYTLPAEMTFISATVPPASTNPLVWHLPDLPAKSDEYVIEVTARVNPSAPPFTNLTSTAVIYTTDTELEILNNEAEGNTYTATLVYLPTIFR